MVCSVNNSSSNAQAIVCWCFKPQQAAAELSLKGKIPGKTWGVGGVGETEVNRRMQRMEHAADVDYQVIS